MKLKSILEVVEGFKPPNTNFADLPLCSLEYTTIKEEINLLIISYFVFLLPIIINIFLKMSINHPQ